MTSWFALGTLSLLALVPGCGSSSSSAAADGPPASTADGGSEAGLTCTPRSGARLRRSVRVHDDGTTVDVAIHDDGLGAACEFETTTDGTFRCVPVIGVVDAQARFADAACLTMLAEVSSLPPGGSESPSIARVVHDDGNPCTNEGAFYALGASVVVIPSVTPIYELRGTTCVASVAFAVGYYAVLGEADLASATASWVGERLELRQFDAEDGSRWCDVWGALIDTSFESRTCSIGVSEDLSFRCFPDAGFVQSMFSDAGCTVEAGVAFTAQCDRAPRFARASTGDGCGSSRLSTLGAPVSGPLYETSAGLCQVSSWSGQPGNFVGEVLPPSEFAEMTRSYVSLGGRLERGDLAGGGVRLFRSQLRDTALEVPCSFDLAADGSLRCLPSTSLSPGDVVANVTSGFSDPACTVPTKVVAIPGGCGRGTPLWAREPDRAYRVGAPRTEPLYQAGLACEPLVGQTLYELGEELAPERFVSGTLSVE